MKEYKIRTIAGGGLSVFVGGGVITFEIKEVANGNSEYYQYFSVDFGFGFKVGGTQGPSDWTEFSSSNSIREFHGYVTAEAVVGNVGGGYGVFNMDFVSGPASGLKIIGKGWTTGLGASFTGSHGWMKLHK